MTSWGQRYNLTERLCNMSNCIYPAKVQRLQWATLSLFDLFVHEETCLSEYIIHDTMVKSNPVEGCVHISSLLRNTIWGIHHCFQGVPIQSFKIQFPWKSLYKRKYSVHQRSLNCWIQTTMHCGWKICDLKKLYFFTSGRCIYKSSMSSSECREFRVF